MRKIVIASLVVLIGLVGVAAARKYEGVVITVFTQTPPYIAKPS